MADKAGNYVKRVTGISTAIKGQEQTIEDYVQLNAKFIGGALHDSADEIAELVSTSVAQGLRHEALAELLVERFAVAASRLALIARDQTLKTYGVLQRAAQTSAGLDQYEWSTSRDERVRPDHVVLEGQIFSWDSPPAVGHPGEDIQCRCVAVPLLPQPEPGETDE